jgi:hypothetical protein
MAKDRYALNQNVDMTHYIQRRKDKLRHMFKPPILGAQCKKGKHNTCYVLSCVCHCHKHEGILSTQKQAL